MAPSHPIKESIVLFTICILHNLVETLHTQIGNHIPPPPPYLTTHIHIISPNLPLSQPPIKFVGNDFPPESITIYDNHFPREALLKLSQFLIYNCTYALGIT